MKVITLNVHNFVDADEESNIDRLISYLSGQNADVICLQEVYPLPEGIYEDGCITDESSTSSEDIDILSKTLNMYYVVGGVDWIGNAILSKERPREYKGMISSDGERGILGVKLSVYTIFTCHLDHQTEETRLSQWKEFENFIESYADKEIPIIICGDFNALTKGDYTDEYISHINSVREKNEWESVQFNLTEKIQEKYIDCYTLYHNRQNPSSCRFGTRIDYIYLRDPLQLMSVAECIFDTKCTCSDHLPCIASFGINKYNLPMTTIPKDTILVHERHDCFPEGRDKPYYHYNWFNVNSCFWSVSDTHDGEPKNDESIVRYVYEVKKDISVIDWKIPIKEWISKIYPSFIPSEYDVDYEEAAFLLQVLGYDGIDAKDFLILSPQAIDSLECIRITKFGDVPEKESSYGLEPEGPGVQGTVGKLFYTKEEIDQLQKTMFSPYKM